MRRSIVTLTVVLAFLVLSSASVLASQVNPDGPMLVGHVTWQGGPVQPHVKQQRPITLVLKLDANTYTYSSQTDSMGNFAVSVATLPSGVYGWWAKGLNSLASGGTVALNGALETPQEMGLMLAGDADNNNAVNIQDFMILKSTFDTTDPRADFNNDGGVTIGDFSLLARNFGQGGK